MKNDKHYFSVCLSQELTNVIVHNVSFLFEMEVYVPLAVLELVM